METRHLPRECAAGPYKLRVIRLWYERVSQFPKYSPVYRPHSFRDRKGGTPKSQRKKLGRSVLACSSRNISIPVRRLFLLDGSYSLQIIDCSSTKVSHLVAL